MNLDKLIESFLIEAAALTKGSQRVMNDKKLVAGLANTVKDDVAINPAAFPPGSKNNFKNATDEAIAQWFLENIDQIEREGYDGTVYSRDGVNSDWIARRYIAGSHNWEDLTGVMNMNLRDWYVLKNRNMLDANHKDLAKFNSVRQVGSYMHTHYKNNLEDLRAAAKKAAIQKLAKSVKLVDNDDYRIYTTLNRAAGCALGLGTQWCTANSSYGGHFHSYSDKAMLFQLFPYLPEAGEDGEKKLNDNVKYQFDAGSGAFMDIVDTPAKPAVIRKNYPYLYTDLAQALKTNKGKLEKAFKELSDDPTLQGADHKIKNYEIDEEIKKLHKFVNSGYFGDDVRPSKEPEPDAEAVPTQIAAKQEQPMESLRDLARAMLEDKTLGHIVQQYQPIDRAGQDSPLTDGGDLEENGFDDEPSCGPCDDQQDNIMDGPIDIDGGLEQAIASLKQTLASRSSHTVDEDDMMQDPSMGGQMQGQGQAQTGGSLSGPSAGGGGGHYAPGTAPTMPESVEQQGEVMEEMDKDVAAMIKSLKTYDKLTEGVLGMVTINMKPAISEKDEGKHNNGKETGFKAVAANAAKEYGSKEAGNKVAGAIHNKMKASGKLEEADDKESDDSKLPAFLRKGKADGKEAADERNEKSGAEVWKDARGKDAIKESEGVDPEILEWMSRFEKLGKMTGY